MIYGFAGLEVTRNCPGSNSPVLYDHGYISSPNYPEKYFRGAHCRWTVAVRRWQTIRITLFDFELDVKRSGVCHDYLEVSSSQTTTTYFDECGATGKQIIDVQSSTADLTFVAAETSSTQRGFFLYYEGNQSLVPKYAHFCPSSVLATFSFRAQFHTTVTIVIV